MSHTEFPAPRENLETIVVCCCSLHGLESRAQYMTNAHRNFADISCQWINTKSSLPVISKSTLDSERFPELTPWIVSRRGASAISEPIEILVVDKSTTDPIPTPPHPSTLKPPGPHRPTRIKLPFTQVYVNSQEKATSVLLTKIIKPLEDLGVVSDTTKTAVNMWRGWMRVPKRGKPWESRKERLDGIQKLDGDFHRVNITYVSCSQSALSI